MNESYIKYQSELGEKAVKAVFKTFYNLELKKIPEDNNEKTPDFEVLDQDESLIAICEVKSLVDTANIHSNESTLSLEEQTRLSIHRDRNHRSKIEKHYNNSIEKFDKYTSIPKIVAFVSFDMTDHIDLDNKLNEYLKLYPDANDADICLIFKPYQSRIPLDTFELKQDIHVRYYTNKGKEFCEQKLKRLEDLDNAVPMTIKV
jgi:hypothetical protein